MSEPVVTPTPPESGAAGDPGGEFEALALPLLGDLYRVAVRLTGRAQDAEDVVHETYMNS